MKKIKAIIRKDGTVKIEVLGAAGADCLELTRGLERRLGAVVGERELKPCFHETEAEVEREREVER